MAYLGLTPKDTRSLGQNIPRKRPSLVQDSMNDEAERLAAAAAALSAVKEAAAVAPGRGKVEVSTPFISTLFVGPPLVFIY